jgi:hypothetical protein
MFLCNTRLLEWNCATYGRQDRAQRLLGDTYTAYPNIPGVELILSDKFL